MSQGAWVTGALLGGFVLFLAANGRFSVYKGLLGL